MFTVILYYKYTYIADPKKLVAEQKALCAKLGLTGRILVAHEGINGTLEGTDDAIAAYCAELKANPLFADINIKHSTGTGSAFPKLMIKVRDEIVSSHISNEAVDPNRRTGTYLLSEELHDWFESKKEFYIVDMRNTYETDAGLFENSIPSGLGNFRDLPQVLKSLDHLRDKTIVTVCTGGVRCEKASAFLVENGFSDVYQLKDGIVTYMETYPNQHFKGKLYVFDQRVLMGFNTESAEHEIIGRCRHCNAISEHFVNCANDDCHLHFINCEACMTNNLAFCSEQCREKVTMIAVK
jgi:UPF0176 protein